MAGAVIAGGAAATLSTTLRGASNAKAKRELGGRPRWSSWRGLPGRAALSPGLVGQRKRHG